MTDDREDRILYLGGAGGDAIVPGNDREIVLELLLVCIRMEKTHLLRKPYKSDVLGQSIEQESHSVGSIIEDQLLFCEQCDNV